MPPTSRCSTSPTIRRASSTRTINAAFAKYWKAKTGDDVTIKQSHGGSGKQARAVIDGLEADVVTLALAYDIDAIAENGKLLPADWQNAAAEQQHALHLDHRVPGAQGQSQAHQGLGRPGEARRRGDHAQSEDLGRRALELSGGLGLRAEEARRQRRTRRKDFVTQLYKNVPVLDTGARGSTTTFVAARHRRRAAGLGERGLSGAARNSATTSSRSSCPSVSILAEPPVAVVDKSGRPPRHAQRWPRPI